MGEHNTTIAIAYIPVLHRGYQNFVDIVVSKGTTHLYLIGDSILSTHDELDYINRKDRIRALDVADMRKVIRALTDIPVSILEESTVKEISANVSVTVLAPDEDISRFILETYFKDCQAEYVPVFLRWHRDNTGETKEVEESYKISKDTFDKEVIDTVTNEGAKSFDWWRQVGAAIVKDGVVIALTCNKHMPDLQYPNVFGDPRSLTKRGVDINVTTSAHAEGTLIAEAAKKGVSLQGAWLYVTDFPCPYCARIIAKSGITKVYFKNGYAVLDGGDFLKQEGIEVVRVV